MYNIAVIGCGVIGLTSAIEIQKALQNLARVEIFTEELSPNTTGDVSAGLWTPYLLQDTKISKVVQWSKATRDYLIDFWKTGYADELGICLQPITILAEEKITEPIEWLPITFGHHFIPEGQLRRDGFTFIAFTCEPTKLLPFLQKQFIANGGKITIKKILDFEELSSYDVIVNCTGLYSEILVNDKKIKPIRGQVSRVRAPWMGGVFMELNGCSYIIPNSNVVVLGGTSQLGNYNTQVDEKDKRVILEKCYSLVPSLQNAPIIKDSAGLRPSRSEVRIELELKKTKSKILKIIHNYGHGGSGVTLCHGCALEVVPLVKNALNHSTSKL